MKKKTKAWAVIEGDGKLLHLEDTKVDAEFLDSKYKLGRNDVTVVPCEIHYQIPSKGTKK